MALGAADDEDLADDEGVGVGGLRGGAGAEDDKREGGSGEGGWHGEILLELVVSGTLESADLAKGFLGLVGVAVEQGDLEVAQFTGGDGELATVGEGLGVGVGFFGGEGLGGEHEGLELVGVFQGLVGLVGFGDDLSEGGEVFSGVFHDLMKIGLIFLGVFLGVESERGDEGEGQEEWECGRPQAS